MRKLFLASARNIGSAIAVIKESVSRKKKIFPFVADGTDSVPGRFKHPEPFVSEGHGIHAKVQRGRCLPASYAV